MIELLPAQAAAVHEMVTTCLEIRVAVIIIGAIAYKVWMTDEGRTTESSAGSPART